MRDAQVTSYRFSLIAALKALGMLTLVSLLQSCESGSATPVQSVSENGGASPAESVSETEQQLLVRELYGNSTATLYWWPVLSEAPPAILQSAAPASDLLVALPQTEVGAFSITYASNDLPQVALWIRRTGNQELLIYNHGHSGLPEATEQYVGRFLRLAIESGNDVLLTSMPLTGLNTPVPDVEYHIRTRDSAEPMLVDPAIFTRFSHAVYETIDDADSYLHYFIDAAVIPAMFLSPAVSHSSDTSFAELGNAPPLPQAYVSVNYVGLSGGAATGLTTCAVLSLRRCVLVAGVMPDDLRVKYLKNYGDTEQQSRSVYESFTVSRLLRIARESADGLVLLFNEKDSCCFADPSATEFQQRYPEYDIRVLPLDYHGYEPETVLSILRN